MKCKLHKVIKVICFYRNVEKMAKKKTRTHTRTHTRRQTKRKKERKRTLYICVWIFYVHISPKLSYNKLKQIFALKNLTHFFSPAPTNFRCVCERVCACMCVYSFCAVCCVVYAACKFSMRVYTGMRKSYCFKFCTFFWSWV